MWETAWEDLKVCQPFDIVMDNRIASAAIAMFVWLANFVRTGYFAKFTGAAAHNLCVIP